MSIANSSLQNIFEIRKLGIIHFAYYGLSPLALSTTSWRERTPVNGRRKRPSIGRF